MKTRKDKIWIIGLSIVIIVLCLVSFVDAAESLAESTAIKDRLNRASGLYSYLVLDQQNTQISTQNRNKIIQEYVDARTAAISANVILGTDTNFPATTLKITPAPLTAAAALVGQSAAPAATLTQAQADLANAQANVQQKTTAAFQAAEAWNKDSTLAGNTQALAQARTALDGALSAQTNAQARVTQLQQGQGNLPSATPAPAVSDPTATAIQAANEANAAADAAFNAVAAANSRDTVNYAALKDTYNSLKAEANRLDAKAKVLDPSYAYTPTGKSAAPVEAATVVTEPAVVEKTPDQINVENLVAQAKVATDAAAKEKDPLASARLKAQAAAATAQANSLQAQSAATAASQSVSAATQAVTNAQAAVVTAAAGTDVNAKKDAADQLNAANAALATATAQVTAANAAAVKAKTAADQTAAAIPPQPWIQRTSAFADALWNGQVPQPLQQDWMQASDSDLAVCRMFGGFEQSQISGGQSTLSGNNNYLSQLTISLQAQKDLQPDGSVVYQIAWYVEPIENQVQFTINWKTKDGGYEPIAGLTGTAGPGSPSANIQSFTKSASERDANGIVIGDPKSYTEVQLVITGQGAVTAPIIGSDEAGDATKLCKAQFGEICTACAASSQKIASSDATDPNNPKVCCLGGCEAETW